MSQLHFASANPLHATSGGSKLARARPCPVPPFSLLHRRASGGNCSHHRRKPSAKDAECPRTTPQVFFTGDWEVHPRPVPCPPNQGSNPVPLFSPLCPEIDGACTRIRKPHSGHHREFFRSDWPSLAEAPKHSLAQANTLPSQVYLHQAQKAARRRMCRAVHVSNSSRSPSSNISTPFTSDHPCRC